MEAFSLFCDQCKALGHVSGECRSLPSVPVNGSAISNIPIKKVGNEIGVVENIVVDGNIDVVSSKALCPVTSSKEVLISAGIGVVSDLGVEAAGAVVHSTVVGLMGPSLVVVPVIPDADALVMENLNVCNINIDIHELVVCLGPLTILEGVIVLAGSIFFSPTIIEKSLISFVFGDNRVEEVEGHCEVNQVVDVGSSELGFTAESSHVIDLNSPMGALAIAHFVDAVSFSNFQ
ncbi:hypothetical protein KFK09_021669 [Dendrobium nobile]|uniref:Uncharacterized protein n=1 Tax=Dendrobium nobile TaxID=94219 RepID=A0A8T3AQK8_DENNO|nr:hypothetical protein KFK09_021669 [Dendrobium nobile]